MTCSCCRRNRLISEYGEEDPEQKSHYNNLGLKILFPVSFFSAVGGIALLCRSTFGGESPSDTCNNPPCEITTAFNLYLLLGALLTGISILAGFIAAVLVCYLQAKNFDRRQLPKLTIDHNDSRKKRNVENHKKRKTESSNSILSTSKVRPQTLSVIPEIKTIPPEPCSNDESQTPQASHDSNNDSTPSTSHQPSSQIIQQSYNQGADNPALACESQGQEKSDQSPHTRRNIPQGRLAPITETTTPKSDFSLDANKETTHM